MNKIWGQSSRIGFRGSSVSRRVELRKVSLGDSLRSTQMELVHLRNEPYMLCSHVRNWKSGFCANKNLHQCSHLMQSKLTLFAPAYLSVTKDPPPMYFGFGLGTPHICHFFYTGRIFKNQNFHPKKRLKAPKTLKMSLKKSNMSHSQMLGKIEYTLPAKFWRLVGCTEMLSW